MALDREAARARGKFASDADFIIRARVDLLLALKGLDTKDKEIERLREALAAVEEELAQAEERLGNLERRTGERSGGV